MRMFVLQYNPTLNIELIEGKINGNYFTINEDFEDFGNYFHIGEDAFYKYSDAVKQAEENRISCINMLKNKIISLNKDITVLENLTFSCKNEIYHAPRIFPTLKRTTWANVNLNELAHEFDENEENPLIRPKYCENWVNHITKTLKVDYTFGGYLELRSTIWRGHYLDPNIMTHLGVDYNVPANTPVTVPVNCSVVKVYRDMDQNGGWGGLAVFKILSSSIHEYLMYGHLAHDSLPNVGDLFEPGEIVAKTGEINENGGWYPHLHVQRYIHNVWYKEPIDFIKLDGYGGNNFDHSEHAPSPYEIIPMEKMYD